MITQNRQKSNAKHFFNLKKQLIFYSRTVHGPSTLGLPNLGIVFDGTRCAEDKICMNKKCVLLSNLEPMSCPGSSDKVFCSGHGVCTTLIHDFSHDC